MALITGRTIGQGLGQGLGRLMELGIETEIIYSFVIIVCSLMIYFGTKELYGLSSHKGIKYFRQSFLFFALAYFFRSFIKIILLYFGRNELINFLPIFGSITLFIFMYFSSMAIFYLLYSVMWKKWDTNSKKIYLFHLLALVIAILSILFRNPFIYFSINFLLLFFVIFTFHISRNQSKEKKRKQGLHIIYTLLFLFWVLNIMDILIPKFFKTFQLFIYLTSSGIFLAMLYKVLKKVGTN